MRPLLVVALDERIEPRLLLQHVGCGRFRGLRLEGQVHPLMPAVLLGMARRDALDLDAQAQPPLRSTINPF